MALQVWLPLNGDIKNYGASNITVTNNGAVIDSSGKIGSCYSFDGSSTYTTVDYSITEFSANTRYSIAMWVYLTSSGAFIGTQDYHWSLYFNSVWEIRFVCWDATSGHSNELTGTLYNGNSLANSWHHIALTWDGDRIKFYVDGIKSSEELVLNPSGTVLTRSYGINIGGNIYTWSQSYFAGKVNDVRVYDYCLSPDEVKEISKALIVHYPLNGFGKLENQIYKSYSVISGSDSSGLTSEYRSDGSLKVVANGGSWRHCLFENNEQTALNFQNNVAGGDSLTISYDLFIESGTLSIPTMFINANNTYAGFSSEETLTYGKWIRVHQHRTYTTVTDTSYGHFSMHLNFGNLTGTYYVRAFRVEHGTLSKTFWAPSVYDNSPRTDSIVYDCSGYNNDGVCNGDITLSSNSPRGNNSYYLLSTNIGTSTSTGAAYIKGSLPSSISPSTITVSWWANMKNWSYQDSGIMSLSSDANSPSDYQTSTLAQYDNVFRLNGEYPSNSCITARSIIVDNEWHYYTLVYDGSTYKGYRDGVEIVSKSYNQALSPFQYVYIGLNVAGGAWRQTSGYWSNFKIYATALSAEDIYKEYHNFASLYTNGSLSAYDFSEV